MLSLLVYSLGIKVQALGCFYKITLKVWLSQEFSPQLSRFQAQNIKDK